MSFSAVQYMIVKYAQKGYRLLSETPNQAQMVRPKRFSCLLFGVLFLLGIVPGLLYWIFEQDKSALIYDSGYGITITDEHGHTRDYTYDEIDKDESWINWKAVSIIAAIILFLMVIGIIGAQMSG